MIKDTYKHSDKTRAKMRAHWTRVSKKAWNKGLTKNSDSRIKEAANKLSQTLKNTEARKGPNNPMFGKPSGMKGKKHTKETRQKMSESQKLAWKCRRNT